MRQINFDILGKSTLQNVSIMSPADIQMPWRPVQVTDNWIWWFAHLHCYCQPYTLWPAWTWMVILCAFLNPSTCSDSGSDVFLSAICLYRNKKATRRSLHQREWRESSVWQIISSAAAVNDAKDNKHRIILEMVCVSLRRLFRRAVVDLANK